MANIDDLEQYYKELTGNDFSCFDKFGIPKTEFSSLALIYDTCQCDIEETIKTFIVSYRKVEEEYRNELYPYIKEFFNFYVPIYNKQEYKKYFELNAQVYCDVFENQTHLAEYENQLYKAHIPKTTFVDLCTGFNFHNFYVNLEKEMLYYNIDKSMLTCIFLEEAKKRKNVDNVVIINKDVSDVNREDIEGDISIIRANNIWRYKYDFDLCIEKYKRMIMKNGIFLFSENAKDKIFFYDENPYKLKNIPSYFIGWEQSMQLNFGDKGLFDTLKYSKVNSE